jgi:limonene-1,2-epoxide hydrolase
MVDRKAVVLKLVEAQGKLDLEGVLALFAEDAKFDNMPMAPIRGKADIRKLFTAFFPTLKPRAWDVLSIAESADGTVLIERRDNFTFADGRQAVLPVMGAFEINDSGLITYWRDYFDLGDWNIDLGRDVNFIRRRQPTVG